ncbi:MAG: radical SAM protein [Treponema sp.]|nr:radical SAM protein [Treponema sp.]
MASPSTRGPVVSGDSAVRATGNLYHGGIMVNYRCNAACRHCLYACSPTRTPGYISRETMAEICGILRRGHIGSVHIGGGEPFLDFTGLVTAIAELKKADIDLDYVETNAFWARDDSRSREYVRTLKELGAGALCISLDPYHAEYVPYGLPLKLARLCDSEGLDYFLWKQQFLPSLSGLEALSVHSREELEKHLRPGYISATARDYGLRIGGRAINIEEEYGPSWPLAKLLRKAPACPDLLHTGHFHVDLEGCFIPPGCTGLRLPLAEAVDGIPPGKYPLFEALYEGGVAALLDLAAGRGFVPEPSYPSRCNLCFHIRAFLAGKGFAELDENHYKESLTYYSRRDCEDHHCDS